MSESMPIGGGMYFSELHDALAELGASVLKKTIPAMLSGDIAPMPQDGSRASRAPIIQKGDGELDFSNSAERLVNTVRAFSVWPGATADIGGRRIKVHRAFNGGSSKGIAAPGIADANANATAPGAAQSAAQSDTSGIADANAGAATGSVVRVNRDALSILCGDGNLFNITRLQFENGRAMDISECWHNL